MVKLAQINRANKTGDKFLLKKEILLKRFAKAVEITSKKTSLPH